MKQLKPKNMFDVDLEVLRTNLLGASPVHFTYFKLDGSTRMATGTLHESLIPEDLRPKDSSVNVGDNLKYFDLDKNAWRSLGKDVKLVQMME